MEKVKRYRKDFLNRLGSDTNMSFIKTFISEQIANPEFEELYKKAKLEEKIALDLIKLRKEAKMPQSELAKKWNTRQSSISSENAESSLTLSSLIKHTDALGVEVEVIFKKKHEHDLLPT
jgi:DNA-binding XRE family transcriptional regulator